MEEIDAITKNSSFVENMMEHVFISEILQEAWIKRKEKIDILRAEVDDSGYDIIISKGNTTRYIQLKTSIVGGKRRKQKLNINLVDKLNGCIVWMIRDIDERERFKLKYLYFGSPVGCKFPDISIYKIGKYGKGNAHGVKLERPAIREIPKSAFKEINTTSSLYDKLFNE